jgi:hypothetical protein
MTQRHQITRSDFTETLRRAQRPDRGNLSTCQLMPLLTPDGIHVATRRWPGMLRERFAPTDETMSSGLTRICNEIGACRLRLGIDEVVLQRATMLLTCADAVLSNRIKQSDTRVRVPFKSPREEVKCAFYDYSYSLCL